MSKTLIRKLLPMLLALTMMVLPLASSLADVASATDLIVITPDWVCESWDKTYDGKGVTPSATIPVGTLDEKERTEADITILDAKGNEVNSPVVNAGEYTVIATVTYGTNISPVRYEKEFTKTLTIKPAAATLKAEDQTKVYGEKDPTLTATASGLIGSDTLDYTITREDGEDVGEYDITIKLGNNPNYTVKATDATMTITKKPVTLEAEDQTKVYGEKDPTLTATASGLVGSDTLDYTITREDGEDVGEYDITIKLGNNPNYTVKATDATMTITKKPVTLKADTLSKNYGESDPEELTAKAEGLEDEDTLNYEIARAEGEAIGEYDITITLGENPNYDVTATGAIFTIEPKFAGSIDVENDTVTNRTNKVEFTVSGISAKLDKDTAAVLKVKATGASNGATIQDITFTENGSYTAEVTGVSLNDATSKQKYFAYLQAGDYDLVLTMPAKDGTEDETIGTLTVAPDSVSVSVENNNADNDKRNLIGAESKDVLSFTPDKYTVINREMGDSDQEIVKLNVTVNGESIYSEDKYVAATAAGDTIASDLASHIPSNVHTVPVVVTAEVVSPDLTPATVIRNFTYDAYALEITEDDILNLNNRTNRFQVKLPELGKITSAVLTGFGTIKPETITYEDNEGSDPNDGFGRTANIPVNFGAGSMPIASKVDVTIEYVDYAGNVKTYTATGIDQASVKGISLSSIEPMAVKQEDNSYLVKGTNILRISGYSVGYERMVISLTAPNGFKYTNGLTVQGESGNYNPQAQDYWVFVIGDRNAEDNLELPMNTPITMKINYADVSGGGIKTILFYDEVCQEAKLLTPAYPGMTVMTGFAESASKVTATWSNGSVDAAVSPQGFFVINFPEGIFDPEITLTITDIAGNTATQTIEVPGRSRDVNMVVNAYPLGAVIQDDTGMPKFIATSVDVATLADGPVELPILAANYFRVGTMTISLGEDGTVAFQPVIDAEYAAANTSYFNIYASEPAADALDEENRGEGLDISAGFKPEEGTQKFWFVYEAPVTLTDDMLTLADGVETIAPDNADFSAFQQND